MVGGLSCMSRFSSMRAREQFRFLSRSFNGAEGEQPSTFRVTTTRASDKLKVRLPKQLNRSKGVTAMSNNPFSHMEEAWGIEANPFPQDAVSDDEGGPYAELYPEETLEFQSKFIRG